MKYILDIFDLFSRWMRDSLFPISMAIIAALLIIFAADINSSIRKLIKDRNFFLRLTIFVCLCAFGYGLAAIAAAKLLSAVLGKMNNVALSPIIIMIFIIIGFIAERRDHM